MYNHFSGKYVQVLEALDKNDACSNHVLDIDRILSQNYGLNTEIYAKHVHEERAKCCKTLDRLDVDENDIILFHFSGFSSSACEKVLSTESLKILHYHNITPAIFFSKEHPLFEHCISGRRQLVEIVDRFDFFTADSEFNLAELLSLGVPKERCFVLPIVFLGGASRSFVKRSLSGGMLFVGRICENKRQDLLIQAYSKLLKKTPELGPLNLVGKYEINDPFYRSLEELVAVLGLSDSVIFKKMISDGERDLLYQNAFVFVSFSEHEGFGVPLLEASVHGLPVLAKDAAAVSETLQNSPGLFDTERDFLVLFDRLKCDPTYEKQLQAVQNKALRRVSGEGIRLYFDCLLQNLIVSPNQFKTISIIICTFNRAEFLDRALDYLCRQHGNCFEVVVVDGPSTDHTEEVIEKWIGQIKFVKNNVRNLSISRNLGVEAAAGDIIAFMDDDAIPFGDWAIKILQVYNSSHCLVGGLGGPTYKAGSLTFQAEDIFCDRYGRSEISFAGSRIPSDGRFRTLLGTNATFPRRVLDVVGGFDEEYDYYLDETDLCLRIIESGFKICHSSDVLLRHEFAQSDNREGRFNYNCYSIVKNTVYFALRFVRESRASILAEVQRQIKGQRITDLAEGLRIGALSNEAFDDYVSEVWRGFRIGVERVNEKRRLHGNFEAPPEYKPFKNSIVCFKPLHVVVVSKEFPPFTVGGGVGTLYYNLVSELLLQGHRVTVIVKGEDHREMVAGRFAINYVCEEKLKHDLGSSIANKNLAWSLAALKRLMYVHECSPVSIVDSSVWDTEAYAIASVRDRLDIPLVVRLVTPFATACELNGWKVEDEEKQLLMEMEKTLVNRSDAVIPISTCIEDTFRTKYGIGCEKKFSRVAAGIAYWTSFDCFHGYADIGHMPSVADAVRRGKKIVLFLGRLELRKGIDVFLKSAEQYCSSNGDKVMFVIAGKDCFGLEDYVASNRLRHLDKNMHYLGELSNIDREKLYSVAYMLVFPSRYESFGLVPLEAFVHGVPVVGANSGAIPEVVLDHYCGLLFADGDYQNLTTQIERLINDAELYEKLSKGAKLRVRELSSSAMAIGSEIVYASVINSKS